jgi:DNA-binding SARP family transcriptional activator
LEAAEAVCAGDPLSADEVLDGVAALVDKSLVTVSPARGDAGEPRYRLLETVRQYAHERLTEAGELAAYRERHARHFLDRAEALAPLFLGGWGAGGAVARLGADRDNLRIATGWVLHEAPDGRMALRFADALFWFWYGAGDWLGRGQFAEGHAYMEAALARDDEGDPLLRARVLLAAGMTAHPQGAYEHALARVDEAHAVFAAHGDLVHAAVTLGFAAACHLMLGAVDRAWTMIQEADAMVRPLPPGVVHGFPGVWYVWTALVRGDIASAERRGAELLHMGESLGHPTMIGHQSMLLGRTALATGDLDAAAVHLVRAFRSHEEIGDGWGIGLDLEPLAALAHARGRHEDAVRLDGAGDAHRARIAVTLYATDLPARRQREHDLRARLGAEFDRLHAEGGALTRDQFADLVAAATSSPDAPAPQASDERPLLEVRTLGALEVVLDGRPVEAAAWGSARTRELLVLLLAHPDGLTKEQVGVALWPEASTTQLRNNFHVTLHRLRRALGGAERVVLQGERYRIDGPVAFDARRFEEEVVAGQRALSRGDADGAAALERALAPYRAPFLDGEPVGDWHVPVRDRLQRLHTRGLAALGAHLAAAGRLREAAATYERLLAHDPLDEEATRGLMHALARLGDRPAALRAYERMRAALRAELEVSPRPETVALAATLRRTNDD